MWHNLVQRYKTLIENESDHSKITWAYFKQLHNIMTQIKNSDLETIGTKITKSPFDSNINQNLIEDKEHGNEPVSDNNESKQEVTSLNDILNYLKLRDQKQDAQIQEMMHIMQRILNSLQQ